MPLVSCPGLGQLWWRVGGGDCSCSAHHLPIAICGAPPYTRLSWCHARVSCSYQSMQNRTNLTCFVK